MATVDLYISALSGGKYTINTAGMSDLVALGREELLPDFFGELYNKALALFALHHKTKADGGNFNSNSNIKSETSGKWSITYGGSNSNTDNNPLSSTYFGACLLELINNSCFIPRTMYDDSSY